jgi:tRNA-2-methylthio-N6-dimethylallyladenosine synthase
LAHIRRFLGRTMRVLVEGKSNKTGLLGGFTDNYIEVHFAGPSSLVREMCYVKLSELRDGVVFGELATPDCDSELSLDPVEWTCGVGTG